MLCFLRVVCCFVILWALAVRACTLRDNACRWGICLGRQPLHYISGMHFRGLFVGMGAQALALASAYFVLLDLLGLLIVVFCSVALAVL